MPDLDSSSEPLEVLIVGAGVAGLSAARGVLHALRDLAVSVVGHVTGNVAASAGDQPHVDAIAAHTAAIDAHLATRLG